MAELHHVVAALIFTSSNLSARLLPRQFTEVNQYETTYSVRSCSTLSLLDVCRLGSRTRPIHRGRSHPCHVGPNFLEVDEIKALLSELKEP